MNLLGTYQNGNYTVTIYDDGTKVRENDIDNFSADFPECMDVKITNKCDLNCAYCHEDSRNDGLLAIFLTSHLLILSSRLPKLQSVAVIRLHTLIYCLFCRN